MKLFLLIFGVCLYLQSQVKAELGRGVILRAVQEAKKNVDSAYTYSRRESVDRLERSAGALRDIYRLQRQPVGLTRSAVRSADYMHYAIEFLKSSSTRRHRRSINATDLISEEALNVIAELTGCSPRHRVPSCSAPSLDKFRSASSDCNNKQNPRWGSSNTPFQRWVPAQYQDGLSLPKSWNPDEKVNNYILPLVLYLIGSNTHPNYQRCQVTKYEDFVTVQY